MAREEKDLTLYGADKQRRQDQPKRSLTSPGIGFSPPIPPAPAVPLEHARTVKAPVNPLRHDTVARPAPPSTMRHATPSVLPEPEATRHPYGAPRNAAAGFDEAPTSIRVTERGDASSGPPGATPLPPPSQDPASAQAAAKDRELARLRRERDEARKQAQLAKESVPPPPDGSLESLRKAQTKLYLAIAAALVALATPLGIYLTAAADAARTRSERAAAQAGNAVNAADSAKQVGNAANAEVTKLREEFLQYRANMNEVLRLQGIDAAKRAGDPAPNDLDPVVPFCPRGKVCPGPQLQLRNAP